PARRGRPGRAPGRSAPHPLATRPGRPRLAHLPLTPARRRDSMQQPSTYQIIADHAEKGAIVLFRWTRGPEAGIQRAREQADEFGMAHLSNFRAEPLTP